jgi:hypothetical protein
MAEPISPEDVVQAKLTAIPDAVIEAFNEMIAKEWNGHEAIVRQPDVVKAMRERDPSLTRYKIIENGLLDVEPIYRARGWAVMYDKPGWDENYDPYFTFSLPDKS